jgi:hypothetical protein
VPGIDPSGTGFTVTGLANGAVVARADGQALVTANTTTPFPVDLALVGGPQGASVELTWTFDDQVGQVFGCAGSGADSVAIQLNDGAQAIVPCYDFAHPGLQGVTLGGLPAASLGYSLEGWPTC